MCRYHTSGGLLMLVDFQKRTLAVEQDCSELQCGSNVILVAHCAAIGGEHKITLSSGFALNIARERVGGEAVILTCAHTLEEIRQSPRFMGAKFPSDTESQQSGSFVVKGGLGTLEVFPITQVLSALPRSDLLLLSCSLPEAKITPLAVSPYPAHKSTPIQAHLVRHEQLILDSTWGPWIGDSLGKWEYGTVAGYRDFAGGETQVTQPGTYDALSRLFFTPIPTAGSSGGPIIDKETGAVVV